MDPQRTARARASERARRVEATVSRTTDRAAYPVRAEELASEYGSAELNGEDLQTAIESSNEGEFDSPTEVREAIRDVLDGERSPAEATFDERERR